MSTYTQQNSGPIKNSDHFLTSLCDAFSLDTCGLCQRFQPKGTECIAWCARSGARCRRDRIGSGIDRCFQHVVDDTDSLSVRQMKTIVTRLDQGHVPMSEAACSGYSRLFQRLVSQRSSVINLTDPMTIVSGFLDESCTNMQTYDRLCLVHPRAAEVFRLRIHSLSPPQSQDILDADVERMVATFPNLLHLDLSGGTRITDVGLRSISRLTRLTTLDLVGCWEITDVGIWALSTLTRLEILSLEGCGDNISGMGLSAFGRLQELDVGACEITDVGMLSWTGFVHLKKLGLSRCSEIGRAHV